MARATGKFKGVYGSRESAKARRGRRENKEGRKGGMQERGGKNLFIWNSGTEGKGISTELTQLNLG
jgi:hypothetical protein